MLAWQAQVMCVWTLLNTAASCPLQQCHILEPVFSNSVTS